MHTQNILQAASGLSSSAVRIGFNHGYAFDGDSVRLDAELVIDNPDAAASREWALQLWACHMPFDGAATPATKVAEVPVGPHSWVSAQTLAFPPAGQATHAMVLVLASGRDGKFEQVEDYANFPHSETFVQPRLTGTTGFALGEKSVTLSVDGIANPRPADNLSGTLSLELWAFADAAPQGLPLAVASLGSLAGQSSLADLALEAPLVATPAGTWKLALLLREWTSAGFVTRDFTSFALPVSWSADGAPTAVVAEETVAVAAPEAAAQTTPEAVAAAARAEAAPAVAVEAGVEAAPEVALEAAPEAAAEAEAEAETTVEVAAPEAAAQTSPEAVVAAARAEAALAAAPAASGVSINQASAAELAGVKGLPKAVASAIVKARPFTSLDELLKVKGMGVKMLDKLKGRLSL